MRNVIVVRHHADWAGMTRERFLAQPALVWIFRRLTPEQVYAVIEAWDEVFGLTYFEFRQALRNLSYENWSDVTGLDAVIDNIKLLPEFIDHYRDATYCFIEDDDWYDPSIFKSLNEVAEPNNTLQWREVRLNLDGSLSEFKRHRELNFNTNNYAFRHPFWEALTGPERDEILVDSHGLIGRLAMLMGEYPTFVPKKMCVTIKSVASVTNLREIAESGDREKFKRDLTAQRDLFLNSSLVGGEDMPWANKYVDKLKALYARL